MLFAMASSSNINSSVYIGSDLYVWTNGSTYGSNPGKSTPAYTSCGGLTCTVSNGTYPYIAKYVHPPHSHIWYVQEMGPPDWNDEQFRISRVPELLGDVRSFGKRQRR